MSTPLPSTPTVRIRQSTPSPAPAISQRPMLVQSAFVGSGWGNESRSSPSHLSTPSNDLKRRTFHKRKSSGSSVTTGGPPSPHDYTVSNPHILGSDLSLYDGLDYSASPHTAYTSKPLPTPTQPPTTHNFMASGYPNASHVQDANAQAQFRRFQSSAPEEDAYCFSTAPSVSTMTNNSPATPHTNYEVEYDEKTLYSGEDDSSVDRWMDEYLQFGPAYQQTPAYRQTLQDLFPDQMYAHQQVYQPQAPQQMSRLNPHVQQHRVMIANRLQAATQDHLSARTGSPITSIPRDQSPFRQNSPFIDQQRISQGPGAQVNVVPVTQAQEQSKSVSPKELMLDEHDIDEAPSAALFPSQSNTIFGHHRRSSHLSNFQNASFNGQYQQMTPAQVPRQYPFVPQQESMHRSNLDQTPEFAPHLTSMDSTVDESSSEPSSQLQHPVQRPSDTSSDAGTYTCTYHGCSQRFETPAQLQKHKREGHRQLSPASGHDAHAIALRNSQAGPHKCERINPSTGKPCNSIFSRPYDLTRHEDTIHNAKKQKVRCHLCTEEKTFSRNDALTRHMRVVHPDVDWPGKKRRKGQ